MLIKAKYVIKKKNEVIEDGAVLVDGKFVKEVGKAEELESQFDGPKMDLGNSLLMPGFVNTHTHAAMVLMRGLADDLPLMEWLQKHIWPLESKFVDEEFIRIGMELALVEMIRSGTTTFADMYFFQDTAAQVVKKAGLRALLGEGVIDFPTPRFDNPWLTLKFTRDFVQEFKDDELVYPVVAPHAPYSCSKNVLEESKKLADEFGVRILIHVAETQDEVKQLVERYGKTPVRYLESFGFLDEKVVCAHGVWLDDEEIEIMARTKAGISHQPSSNLKLASGIAPVDHYIKAGVRIGLGTDGAASNNDLDMVEEMHIAALIQKVKEMNPTALPAWEAFHMATQGGAEILGLGDKIGTIEPGKYADLIAFGLDAPHLTPIYNPISHLVYAAKASDIHFVMVGGKILMEKGELKTLDEEAAIEKARRFSRKFLE